VFEFRIAGNYRSPRLVRLDAPADPAFDVYEGDHFTIDLGAKWRLVRHWQLQFDAINLTDRPLYEYYGDPQHLARYETYGRTYRIGLRCDL
jgi:outer membrane receptor protein involved in Fe transport